MKKHIDMIADAFCFWTPKRQTYTTRKGISIWWVLLGLVIAGSIISSVKAQDVLTADKQQAVEDAA